MKAIQSMLIAFALLAAGGMAQAMEEMGHGAMEMKKSGMAMEHDAMGMAPEEGKMMKQDKMSKKESDKMKKDKKMKKSDKKMASDKMMKEDKMEHGSMQRMQ